MRGALKAIWNRRRPLKDVPTWQLLWFILFPIGSAAFFFVGNLRRGSIGWAGVFAVILGVSVVTWTTAIIAKYRARFGSGHDRSN
jgi:Flp pilus assembly protein TadB